MFVYMVLYRVCVGDHLSSRVMFVKPAHCHITHTHIHPSHHTPTSTQTLVDGFLNPADNGPPCHRIAVFEMQHVGGSMPTTRITHIVTQTDIIRYVVYGCIWYYYTVWLCSV